MNHQHCTAYRIVPSCPALLTYETKPWMEDEQTTHKSHIGIWHVFILATCTRTCFISSYNFQTSDKLSKHGSEAV